MESQNIVIKELAYEKLGSAPAAHWKFAEDIQRLDDRGAELALRVALGECPDSHPRLEEGCQIAMTVAAEGAVYLLRVLKNGEKCRRIWRGEPKREYLLPQCDQEYKTVCFDPREPYQRMLQQYWHRAGEFAGKTGGIVGSKTFRWYLQSFIRSFQPEKLLPQKDLWLCIQKDGTFYVGQGEMGQPLCHLAETDQLVFRYLCFAHFCRFWENIRELSRFPAFRPPLLIRDFSDRLDAGVDFEALLQRGQTPGRQVFLLEA